MRTDLKQDEIEFYQDNGFVILHDFLNDEELKLWSKAVDEAVKSRGKFKLLNKDELSADEKSDLSLNNGQWQDGGDNYYDKVFIQRINLWMDNEKVRKLITNPAIGEIAAKLANVNGIRIWHDQALIKEPWAKPTGWHLDNPKWSYNSKNTLSIWIALDDATLSNGCMYFIPGSHKMVDESFDDKNLGGPIGQNIGDLFKIYPQLAKIKSVPAPMKAGSCSFHNGLLAHGAGANMTPSWRRAMTCGFMPDGCTFNGTQNVLPDSYFNSLKIGDTLNNEEQNPLIFSM